MVLRSCEGAGDGYKAIIGRQDIGNSFATCSSPPWFRARHSGLQKSCNGFTFHFHAV